MTENHERKSNITRLKGVIKFGLGIISWGYPASFALGAISCGAAILSGIVAGGSKLVSIISPNPNTKDKWNNRSKKCISFGTKAMIRGGSLLIPFVGAGLLMADGAQNVYTGKNSFFNKWQDGAATYTSGLGRKNTPPLSPPVIDSPPHQSNNQHASSLNQIQPTRSISNMAAITNASNFDQAQSAYKDELCQTSEDQRYVMGEPQACGNGNYKAIFTPPEYRGRESECPKGLQVEQIFNQDMQVIAVNPGDEATCVLPPIKTPSGFDVKKCENGVSINCRAAAQSVQNMQQNGLGQGVSNIPPPPGKKTQQHTNVI